MSRIHYYVHGRGRGHATRSLPAVAALRADGHHVEVFAGDDAAPLMASAGACHQVRSLRPDQGLGLLPLLISRTADAVRAIRRDGAELVVSDGELPPILAAILTGRRAVAVGHAEIFSRCRRPSDVPLRPWLREALRAWISAPRASRHVAVSFVSLTPTSAKTVVAHPVVPDLPRRADAAASRIVCYFRDDNGDRVVSWLAEQGIRPILHSAHPKDGDDVEHLPLDREAFLMSLSTARAVVASAGSQLISECVHHGIPIFALFDDRDDEQRVNVSMLRAAGIGDGCSFSEIDDDRLATFLASTEESAGRRSAETPDIDVAAAVCEIANALTNNSGARKAVCVLGHHEPDYPRNRVLQEALEHGRRRVVLCHSRAPFPWRHVVLGAKYLRSFREVGVVLVTEGGHRLVPAVTALAHLTGRRVVFDPFTSRYNTKIEDRELSRPGSYQALVCWWQDWSSTHAADAVIFDTDEHRDYFGRKYSLDKTTAVVPVGVPGSAFEGVRHEPRVGGDLFRVLFYGTYIPLQGAETIVSAAALLADGPDLVMEMIGEGQTYGAVMERARALGVVGRPVAFEPSVPFEALPHRLARADVALGIFGDTDKARRVVPNKVVQAAAVGVPIITADTPAIRRYFVHGESIFLVPPADSKALAEAITDLRNDDAHRARLGAGARQVYERHFSLDAISRALCDVVEELERS